MGVVHNISVAHICRVYPDPLWVRCGVHVVDKGKYENNIRMKRRITLTVCCSAFAEWIVRVNTILFAHSSVLGGRSSYSLYHFGAASPLGFSVYANSYAVLPMTHHDCVHWALSACHLWKFNSWKPSDVSRRVPLSLAIYLFLSFIIILNHCYYYCVCSCCCCWFAMCK